MEAASVVRPYASLEAYALNPEYIDKSNNYTAIEMARNLHYALAITPEIHDLDQNNIQSVYNPELPTLAIDVNGCFTGAELLGMANNRRAADKTLNVLYVNTATAGLKLDNGLTARRGFFVGQNGDILITDFGQDIPIKVFETIDTELLPNLASLGVLTLSKPDTYKYFNNKNSMDQIGTASNLTVPERLSLSDLLESSQPDAVIKPSSGSQGRGVYFTARHPGEPDKWEYYYNFLNSRGYDPIIEKRVNCWPVRDPKSKELLDWNVRAIVSDGQLIDMYVRAGPRISAVNKSTGAQTIPMNKFYRLVDDSGSSSREIKKALSNAASDFAGQNDVFMTGLDLTINDMGQVVLFEANAGFVGGLQTIAHLDRGSINHRLKNANKLLDGITGKLGLDYGTANLPPKSNGTVKISFESLASFASTTGLQSVLGALVLTHGVPTNTSLHASVQGIVEACNTQQLQNSIYRQKTSGQNDPISLLLHKYPLELPAWILGNRVDSAVLGSPIFLEGIHANKLACDDESKWQTMLGIIYAGHYDLSPALGICRDLLAAKNKAGARAICRQISLKLFTDLQIPKHFDKDTRVATATSLATTIAIVLDDELNLSGKLETVPVPSDKLTEELSEIAGTIHGSRAAKSYYYAKACGILAQFNRYDVAGQIAAKIDLDDELAGDTFIDQFISYGEHMVASRPGREYFLRQHERLGVIVAPIITLLEARNHVDLDNIEREIAYNLFTACTDEEKAYIEKTLTSIFHQAPVPPLHGSMSGQEMLVHHLALTLNKTASSGYMDALATSIRTYPKLALEVDAVNDLRY